MMLDEMKIENYRGIDNFKIENIKPITILVGRNNTGKSSILECVSLLCSSNYGFYDSLGNDLYGKIIERRGGDNYLDTIIQLGHNSAHIEGVGKNINNTINLYNENFQLTEENVIMVNSVIDRYITEYQSRLNIDFRRRYSPEEYKSMEERLRFANIEIERIQQDILNNVELYIEIIDNNKMTYDFLLHIKTNIMARLSSIMEERFFGFQFQKIIRSFNRRKSNIVFMVEPRFEYLQELQRRVAKSGDLINVLRRLRQTITNFEDIREVEDDFVIYMKNSNAPLPLKAMGDGFQAQLAILSGLSTIRRGAAVMEEPETKLHPGYMMSITEQIIDNSNNIQYFISTHNIELIEMILDINSDIVNVVRLFKEEEENVLDYEIMSGAQAIEEIDDLKLDLRGI